MDLLSQLTLLLRAKANAFRGAPTARPPPTSASASTAQSAALLKTAEERATKVKEQLVLAESREQNAAQAWRDERAQADAIELELNAAVRAGHDEVARTKLTQINQLQNNIRQLSERWRHYATSSEKLRIELQDLDAQLTAIHRRVEPAPPAARVKPAEQQLSQPAEHTQSAPMAQPSDAKTDAGKTLDQTRIADLLKRHDAQSKS